MAIDIDNSLIAMIVGGVTSLLALGYKAIRIIKSDKTSDAIDSDEQQFRLSLREECKALREQNYQLCQEKILLIERAVRAESERDYLIKKCEECIHKLGETQ